MAFWTCERSLRLLSFQLGGAWGCGAAKSLARCGNGAIQIFTSSEHVCGIRRIKVFLLVYDRSSRDVSEKWHLTAAGVSLVALNFGRPIGRDGRSLGPGDRLRWQPSHQLKPTLNYFDLSSPRTV